MRRMLAVAALLAATAACGSSAPTGSPIVFGLTGGNIRPFSVTIRPNGSVHERGTTPPIHRRQIPPAEVQRLQREIKVANLASRNCTGALPDTASRYIRSGGRTVTVHGSCDTAFERIWNKLVAAVGGR